MKRDILDELRIVNVIRAEYDFHTYRNVNITYFTSALAGEVGELCNAVKKLERAKVHGPDIGTSKRLTDISKESIAEECADILIYLDLIAALYDIDLSSALLQKFNATSDQIGSTCKL